MSHGWINPKGRQDVKHFIIDRFEGDSAIVELPDKTMVRVPRRILPLAAGKGDTVELSVDKEKAPERIEEIRKILDELWGNNTASSQYFK